MAIHGYHRFSQLFNILNLYYTVTKLLLFLCAILGLANLITCQYPVDSSALPDPKKFLIIDAALTDSFGKVNVAYTLSEVTPQGGYLFPTPPDATAYVLDSHGNRTDFTPNGTKNNSFHGVVGETYKLYVQADGQVYESQSETMPACPEIDSLTAVYSRESSRSPNDLAYDGFDIYAEFRDIPNQESYYQWDWIHYRRTFSCDVKNGFLVPCTPYDCWSITYNQQVIVQSDKLRDGQPIAHKVARAPFATPPHKFYYIRVEQRAITASVYAYLKSLETQTQNVGSIFDVPAQTKFNPNVFNVNNPAEQILGVFSMYSTRHKVLNINMQQNINGVTAKVVIDYRTFTTEPLLQAPCTEGLYRTQIRPEGWSD
jgi:hypothetical protein